MKSPFPGMDPWLEGSAWPDVHHGLAFWFADQLTGQVIPKYFVRVSTYTVEDKTPDEDVGIMYPDVEILKVKQPLFEEALAGTEWSPGVLTPATLEIPFLQKMEVRVPVVEIVDREKQQLITAIEILSPVNKRGEGLETYREKRQLLRQDGVHLLEVDLLRRGERPFRHAALPRQAHYFVMLMRGNRRKTDVWAMTVREKLPVVPVPLKGEDEDVALDICKAFSDLYQRKRYDLSVNYQADPPPPAFEEEDWLWLRQLLKEKKLA